MLIALNKNKDRKYAKNVEKKDGPFFCPICNHSAFVKKGKVKIHHFAHEKNSCCDYGAGESQLHYKVKTEIYNALKKNPKCTKVELERNLTEVRPDISFYADKHPVAVEIQKSAISIDLIIKRTLLYTRRGIYLVWILPSSSLLKHGTIEDKKREFKPFCKPKEWIKFLHGMYFGRVYAWLWGAIVTPIHFGPFKYYVEERNWVDDWYEESGVDLEGTDWHEENHYSADYGGYYKNHKTKRTYELSMKGVDLADDFKPSQRPPFSAKNWQIPAAKIWMDNLKKWW